MSRFWQRQRAGSDSQQVTAGTIEIHNAEVTAVQAKDIASSAALEALRAFSAEAVEEGRRRTSEFEVRLLDEFGNPTLRQVFADPSFQVLLQKAELTAACTERDTDYEILAKLLAQRAERPKDRRLHLAVDRSVEVLDKLTDEALSGLTAIWWSGKYSFSTDSLTNSLTTMEPFAQRLCEMGLPSTYEWLDDLEVLGCVRRVAGLTMSLRKYKEMITLRTPGYVSAGFNEEEREQVLAQAGRFKVEPRPHPFLVDRFFLEVPSSATVVNELRKRGQLIEGDEEALGKVFELARVDEVSTDGVAYLEKQIKEYPAVSAMADFWDAIPETAIMTLVGDAVSYASMRRFGDIPGLEMEQVLGRQST